MLLYLIVSAVIAWVEVDAAGAGAARLVCYVSGKSDSLSECTHLVYTGDARGDKLDGLLKEYRKGGQKVKILVRVTSDDEDLRSIFKSKHVQGLEVFDAHKSLNKTKVSSYVEKARQAVSSAGGGPLFLSLPGHPELLAKYYDLRTLIKLADLMMVQTHALGLAKKMTYHPSRLSGLWDMMNTDSVVDLVVGLGVPPSKVVISLPATARQFKLQNESLSTPGSPAKEEEPLEIDQAQLCQQLSEGRWTLERDQDLAAPYAFKNKTWISFEDSSSVDVKGKYARVRGLAGLALYQADRDATTACGPTLRTALAKVLNAQSRAPRAAVLRSLEHEILSSPATHGRVLDELQVSPYRITQIVDSDGVIHSIREDTRTEFSCSRQGYFVHPRSCARFYRCVKFDQLSPDYTVFEFDCPAGLAFDSRYEVCVWPGSLPHSQACPGSSEIAPVPQTRFVCPEHEGYYADPENCRWFFACLDHGKAPLSAYEFRCPFGLGFDAARLQCDWPWLVPACGNIARYEAQTYGFSAALLTGATGFHGKTADAVNVAAHQSLVSGASLNNLVGIQGGFLSTDDALNGNFIASEEIANGAGSFGYQNTQNAGVFGGHDQAYQVDQFANNEHQLNLVKAKNYKDNEHYTSGSLILDEYRLPSNAKVGSVVSQAHSGSLQHGYAGENVGFGNAHGFAQTDENSFSRNSGHSGTLLLNRNNNFKSLNYQNSGIAVENQEDVSGAYIHDPSGDYGEPYKHIGSPTVPYIHEASVQKPYNDFSDYGKYNGNQYISESSGKYAHENPGSYSYHTSGNSGDYKEDNSGAYKNDYTGSYVSTDSGITANGIYNSNAQSNPYGGYNSHLSSANVDIPAIGNYKATNFANIHNSYSNGDRGDYLTGANAYTGASHTLTAGAVNVGLVGKTTLVDGGYIDQRHYQSPGAHSTASYSQAISHDIDYQKSQPSYISQPGVSVSHAGTDINSQNLNTYSYVTTPTTSGIPTTATPIAVTTAIPAVTYKTTYFPEQPKTSVKQIFGYSQPPITFVQPTVVAVTASPKIEVNHGQNGGYTYQQSNYPGENSFTQASADKSDFSGYNYDKPVVKFEDGIELATPASPVLKEYSQPAVVTFRPRGFTQNTVHKAETVGYSYPTPTVAFEEPTRKAVAYTTGPPVVSYAQPTVSTYKPQIHSISHQTIHKVDTSNINQYSPFGNSGSNGYEYSKPVVRFEETPKTVLQYTTIQPAFAVQSQPVISTYKPQSYSHQTVHKIEPQKFIPAAPSVSLYENPFIKHTQEFTPALSYVTPTAAVYTQPKVDFVQTYQPVTHQHEVKHVINEHIQYQPIVKQSYDTQHIQLKQPVYSYNQPEIQSNIEIGSGLSYSQPSVITHQVHHKASAKTQSKIDNNNAVFVSSTPSNVIYEEHYSEYEAPKTPVQYKAPDYLPPKNDYIEPYVAVTTPVSVASSQQHSVVHDHQARYNYKAAGYAEQSDLSLKQPVQHQQVYFSTQHIPQPKLVESIHLSSYPSSFASSTYKPLVYDSPEIQVGYQAEEYLPPVISTVRPISTPLIKTQTLIPTVSTTVREYLPPAPEPKYTAPEYLPPTTARPIVKYTTQGPTLKYETPTTPLYRAPEYLPPVEVDNDSKIVNFESFRLKNTGIDYSQQTSLRPIIYSTTTLPIQRNQNVVVQKAKSNVLGFGTVGPDAGLVSEFSYSTQSPVVTTETQSFVPINHEFVDVAPSPVPVRRTKPKMAVVTKINDFNPLLVRKLGAVCSCQSPVLVLKGKRPNVQRDYDVDYNNDYDDSGRGDISDYELSQKSRNKSIKTVDTPLLRTVTVSPTVTSTFNPIIVPDDSYYQDYQEQRPKQIYSENYVSSTYSPSTENIVKIRPRSKAVTAAPTYTSLIINEAVTPAPTYRSLILNEAVTPVAASRHSQESAIDSVAFDRYGPGGLRSRDETLQGTVDCQRAGLFRHPKQCNKFYACRWDCTKQRFTLHIFNCPVQLSFDPKLGACNWPSQGPACQSDTLLINSL